jgi:hypothetical protein
MLLKDHEWELTSDISDVLKILTNVTTYMCAEKHISLSVMYPIVFGLIQYHLKLNISDNLIVRKIKETIRQELVRRFQPLDADLTDKVPFLSSLLDPRYKQLSFVKDEQKRTFIDQLESLLDDLPLIKRTRNENNNEERLQKKCKAEQSLNFLTAFQEEPNEPESELSKYLNQKGTQHVDPLKWWAENESQFPNLAGLAKKYLIIPGTSVPSERIFSTPGTIVNKLRSHPLLWTKLYF